MNLAVRWVGPLVPPGVGPVLIAVVVACLGSRWLIPAVLRLLAQVLETALTLVVAVVVLPEYAVSVRKRRGGQPPPVVGYLYSGAVGWVVFWTTRGARAALHAAANAIRSLPLKLVGGIAAGVTVAWLLGLTEFCTRWFSLL